MKRYHCGYCENKVYFDNVQCLRCDHSLGFSSDRLTLVALTPIADGAYRIVGDRSGRRVRYCGNAADGVCNWLVDDNATSPLCRACALNRTIPNLAEPGSLEAWGALERAKKRLVYSLLRLGLPIDGNSSDYGALTFDFVRHATTGHLDGVITIDISEADAVERERQRMQLDEPYRSLLGHLRHESGHYYWQLLVAQADQIDPFRRLFGDETVDYLTALQNHHAMGPPADWRERHVSAYASSHAWEDWAETWAHYLHMVDALETAEAHGLDPKTAGTLWGARSSFKAFDIYQAASLGALIDRWVPLSLALNSLNRSMGHDDFYPFVIPATAVAKLDFIHRRIRDYGRVNASRRPMAARRS